MLRAVVTVRLIMVAVTERVLATNVTIDCTATLYVGMLNVRACVAAAKSVSLMRIAYEMRLNVAAWVAAAIVLPKSVAYVTSENVSDCVAAESVVPSNSAYVGIENVSACTLGVTVLSPDAATNVIVPLLLNV